MPFPYLCSQLYAELGQERCQAVFAKVGGSATKCFMTRPDIFSVSNVNNPPPILALVSEWQTVPTRSKAPSDPLLGLEPEVLCFLHGLHLLFGTEDRDWPQTKEQLQTRAPSLCAGMGSKLFKLSQAGVVIVSQGTRLIWAPREKVSKIVNATPQNIRHAAQAMLDAAAQPSDSGMPDDQSLGAFLYGPSSALAKMHVMNVATVQDLLQLVAQHCSHNPLEAAPSNVRLAVHKGELFNWCREVGGGIRIALSAAVEHGAVVEGGVPPREWVGIPETARPTTASDILPEHVPSEKGGTMGLDQELDPTDFVDIVPLPEQTTAPSSPAHSSANTDAKGAPAVTAACIDEHHQQNSESSPPTDPSSADPTRALQELAMIQAVSDRPCDTATRHAALGLLFIRNEMIKAEERAEAAEARALAAEARASQLEEQLREAQLTIRSLESW